MASSSMWKSMRELRAGSWSLRGRPFIPITGSIQSNANRPIKSLISTTHTRLYSSNHASTAGYPGISQSIEEKTPGNSVATIQISNPSKMNIVNSSILEQLIQSCSSLSSEPSLRAVILTGSPTAPGKLPSFIGGADIKEMASLSSPSQARGFISRVHKACQALRDLPVPVIARVNGFSLGAGLEIMASCDLRLATKNSTFAMPEVAVGIPSVVEAALLPGLIGMGKTRRLLLLAERIEAEEAERWGLVEKVVADEGELGRVVDGWTGRLCEMGPKAVRSQKRLMRRWEEGGVEEGIEAGVGAFAEAYKDGGREPKEFMGKFLNLKR